MTQTLQNPLRGAEASYVQISNEILLFVALGLSAVAGIAWYTKKLFGNDSLDPAEQQARSLALLFHERVYNCGAAQ